MPATAGLTGYGVPDGLPMPGIITLTGLATLVLAPFAAMALNLSAIADATCMRLSGVVVAGFGSALWGVVAGARALAVQQYGRRVS